jgi:hypothetical protein
MPHQQPVTSHEPIAEADRWLQEPMELPPRPRRRLLGAGGNPLALALLGVLMIACGFIGGVLVEKGQSSSSSTPTGVASSLAARFRALRGGGGAGSGAGGGGVASGAGAGFTRPTAGTVAYLAGSTLYVTNAEGNTVKVKTSAATSVTKTVNASLKAIHPGETVTVTGTTGSNGTVSAESISVGSSIGGLAALFGGGAGASARGTGRSDDGSSSSSSEPSLFGGGG